MIDFLNYFHLTGWQFALVILVGLLVGMGKAGISGIVMVAVPILASVLGGKESTGLMNMIFIVGDVFAVNAYRRHAQWSEIKPMLPAAVGGIILGSLVGNLIDDRQFKYLIALMVLICLIFMVIQEIKGANFKVPHALWFIVLIGIVSGFASMIGNAAGPIFAVYLLAIGLDKKNFLGTTAWFFMIINLIKLPIQIITWHNMTWKSVLLALVLLPAIYLGMKTGIWVVKILKEKPFRIMIIVMTALATVRLFF